MSFLMQNEATAIGASNPIKVSDSIQDFGVEATLNSTGTTKITACTIELQGGNVRTNTCVNSSPTLAIGSTAQRIAITDFYYQINGTNYTIATDAVGKIITDVGGTIITAGITGSKFGGLVVCASTAGTIRCIAPGYQVATLQAYDSAALCNAALDAIVIPSGFCYIGKLIITAAGGGFTFGTTALTGVATFYNAYPPFYAMETHVFTEAEITAQKSYFVVTGKPYKFIRTYISVMTGAGYITVKLHPVNR
jgi:hypothetical protein